MDASLALLRPRRIIGLRGANPIGLGSARVE